MRQFEVGDHVHYQNQGMKFLGDVRGIRYAESDGKVIIDDLLIRLDGSPGGSCIWVARKECNLVRARKPPKRTFTLIELLVVLVIIVVALAVLAPTLLSAISHRQASEGARLLQSAFASARDAALRDGAPAGLRLLADPTLANACNRLLPLATLPAYQDGLLSIFIPSPSEPYPASVTLGTGALVVEEQPGTWVLPQGATHTCGYPARRRAGRGMFGWETACRSITRGPGMPSWVPFPPTMTRG